MVAGAGFDVFSHEGETPAGEAVSEMSSKASRPAAPSSLVHEEDWDMESTALAVTAVSMH
jgi:hypothetical protein